MGDIQILTVEGFDGLVGQCEREVTSSPRWVTGINPDKGEIEGVESFTGLLRLPFGRGIRVGEVIMTTYMHE